MSQEDYVVANADGATVRADINAQLDAIVTNNSGASEPTDKFANMWWADTGTNILKSRNQANTGWLTRFDLDNINTLNDIVFEGVKDIYRNIDTDFVRISGGNAASDGAHIEVYGGNHATLANDAFYDADVHNFRDQAGTNPYLTLASGVITLGENDLARDVNNDLMRLSGGNGASFGAHIELYGGTHATLSDDAFYDADTHSFREQGGTSVLTIEQASAGTYSVRIDQSSASGAKPVLQLDQGDVDDTFVDFVGTENGTTGSIKTGVSAHGGTTKAVKIELNGSTYYVLASTAPA